MIAFSRRQLIRRAAAFGTLAIVGGGLVSPAFAVPNLGGLTAEQIDKVKAVNNYFNSIDTLEGKFIQTGPDGSMAEGYFVLDRPGKMRFRYAPPTKMDIISDGKTVAIDDKVARDQTLVFLSDTPLRFLLDKNIDLTKEAVVKSVSMEDDLLTVVLEDPGTFASGKLTLIFDGRTVELRQWTVTDAQGLDTTVAVYDLKSGVATKPEWFKINFSLYK
ncbi:lipoprotein chaperone [Hartmannibacter diazotrophicus]|uniref:Lipoprotein chaperone n=1 Tax=Hartmannibacter diazotrophicus TaxID=1482074 RepID=A0A2C9DBC1_9HYPH|nr:outer membrane lipoprotein carrier protein LolA [Hartmannibacter diazotrophicus]SON57556.1 lipoprotein chaperone [Hartmannibacter diazotrophicus]